MDLSFAESDPSFAKLTHLSETGVSSMSNSELLGPQAPDFMSCLSCLASYKGASSGFLLYPQILFGLTITPAVLRRSGSAHVGGHHKNSRDSGLASNPVAKLRITFYFKVIGKS